MTLLSDYDEELSTTCPLCGEPLDGERHVHPACADAEQARADYVPGWYEAALGEG